MVLKKTYLTRKYLENERKKETKIKLKVKLAKFKKKRKNNKLFLKRHYKTLKTEPNKEDKRKNIILLIFEFIKVIVILLKFLLGM